MPGYIRSQWSNVIPWASRSGAGMRSTAIAAPQPETSRSIPREPIRPGFEMSLPAVTSPASASACRQAIWARTTAGDFIVTESQFRMQEGWTRPSRSTAAITRSPSRAVWL